MNKRDLNRKALGRLIDKTLHPAVLVMAPTGTVRHVVADGIEKCRYQDVPTHKIVTIQIWLEKSMEYGGPLTYFMGNDSLPVKRTGSICRNCRNHVRYYAGRIMKRYK